MAWDLSCKDWESRIKSGRSLIPDLPLFTEQADRALFVFDHLRLADVPGTPYLAESVGPWFRDIVRALFGALDPVSMQRMIQEIFVLVAKKNSKTTYGALMMLVALIMSRRPKAPFIMTAPVHDVAELAFSAAAGAIALDPVLRKKFKVQDHRKTITDRLTDATLQIMTFDPATVTGQKCAGILIDELHIIAKMGKAASAILQLRGGMLPFPEAFMMFITTQSEEAPSGVFKAELLKARAIRDGKRQEPMLPVLYEFQTAIQKGKTSETSKWRDPANWHMVTPNDGRSSTIDRLRQGYDSALATSEEALRAWASQHLNVEVGLALRSDNWVGADYWEQQATKPFTLPDLIERCEVLCVGIDGGGLDDLLGLGIIGRETDTGRWLAWAHGWACPSVIERRKSEEGKFRDFAEAGDLTLVDEIGDDMEQLASLVAHCEQSGKLDKIGIDPAGIGGILDALAKAEVPQDKVVGISQGWKMTGAIKTTERKLGEAMLVHGGQPMMAWCVGNARVEPRGNAIIITKQASGIAKIDPLLATFNAVALMSLNPEAPRGIADMLHSPIRA